MRHSKPSRPEPGSAEMVGASRRCSAGGRCLDGSKVARSAHPIRVWIGKPRLLRGRVVTKDIGRPCLVESDAVARPTSSVIASCPNLSARGSQVAAETAQSAETSEHNLRVAVSAVSAVSADHKSGLTCQRRTGLPPLDQTALQSRVATNRTSSAIPQGSPSDRHQGPRPAHPGERPLSKLRSCRSP